MLADSGFLTFYRKCSWKPPVPEWEAFLQPPRGNHDVALSVEEP
jgi:hypothetical protein